MAMKNRIITVQDIPITVSMADEEDYICITDMAAAKSDNSRAADVIRNWLRNRSTLEFLSTWEEMYNLNFKVFESEHFNGDCAVPLSILQTWRRNCLCFLPGSTRQRLSRHVSNSRWTVWMLIHLIMRRRSQIYRGALILNMIR